jgi:hypothetical protein
MTYNGRTLPQSSAVITEWNPCPGIALGEGAFPTSIAYEGLLITGVRQGCFDGFDTWESAQLADYFG